MHRLLARQLKRLGIAADAPPDADAWRALLERVGATYGQADDDRYTLERSLLVSSEEMQALHEGLRRSEADLRGLVDHFPDAIFVHAGDTLVYANPAMAKLVGCTELAEMRGMSTQSLVHEDDLPALLAHRARRDAGQAPRMLRVRWKRRDGTSILVEGVTTPITFGQAPALLTAARDITERARMEEAREHAERALRLSEERYRVLFDESPLVVMVFDPKTLDILAVNDKTAEVYGFSRAELLARRVSDLKPAEDVELSSLSRGSAREGVGWQPWRGTKTHVRKDGTSMQMEIHSHPVTLDGRPAVLAMSFDATEQRRLEDQLRQSQKMDAIGALAGGVAHDFNNILAVILADADLALGEVGASHPIAGDLREIADAARRAAALTRQLLTFSRKQPHRPRVLALDAQVENLFPMLRRIIGEDIEIALDLERDAGCVVADPSQVDQVVLNLVVNARDAMPRGGKIRIETSRVELGPDEATAGGVEPGPYLSLTVRDEGTGMDEATLARIYEPFFTTKGVGQGTGLGLSTVFGIVKQSAGAITVASQLGAGTSFRVCLPWVSADAEGGAGAAANVGNVTRGALGGESILLVEDEAPLRKLFTKILRAKGYGVCDAASAEDALAAFDEGGARFDLVVTDVVMPRGDGVSMAARMRAVRPKTRFLFMSGYAKHRALDDDVFEGAQLLTKPFTPDILVRAVRAALDGVLGPASAAE